MAGKLSTMLGNAKPQGGRLSGALRRRPPLGVDELSAYVEKVAPTFGQQFAGHVRDNAPPADPMEWGQKDLAAMGPHLQNSSLDDLALATSGIPGVGDAVGLAADGRALYDDPSLLNAGAMAFGALPFVTGGMIRAYHGSPHDFDKFSMDKIGTGEGAQVYGHGLYFAGAEDTAKYYRDQLTDPDQVEILLNEKAIPSVWAEELRETFPEFYRGLNEDDAFEMDALLGTMQGATSIQDAKMAAESVGGRAGSLFNSKIMPTLTKPEYGAGRMYEARIDAKEDDFLDWDTPLSEQPEAVRKAYAAAVAKGDSDLLALLDGSPESLRMAGLFPNSSGAQAYATLSPRDAKAASERLREAGIPGIKYLDQNSRAAGEGSRNYVVFDDALIEVLRKYGIAGVLGGAGAFGAFSGGEAQAAEE